MTAVQVSTTDYETYRWLLSDAAKPALDAASTAVESIESTIKRLHKSLSDVQARLVVEQTALRRRARVKFSLADQMFFTRVGLEQATDEVIARYKANRFPPDAVVDLCCGIGGDLMALAGRGPAIGVDRDAVVALLASHNVRQTVAPDATVVSAVATPDQIQSVAAWHIDPDRRSGERRTIQIDHFEPNTEMLERLLERNPNGAIKIAPAAEIPNAWHARCEREWISSRGECRQQVLWFHSLATAVAQSRATVVRSSGQVCSFSGPTDQPVTSVETPDRYLFDLDPSVRAARLTGHLATAHRLHAYGNAAAYLTGAHPVFDGLVSGFELLDVLPFDLRRVKRLLRERNMGRLELKQHGTKHALEQVRKQLAVPGDTKGTLLLCRVGSREMAIIARRCG